MLGIKQRASGSQRYHLKPWWPQWQSLLSTWGLLNSRPDKLAHGAQLLLQGKSGALIAISESCHLSLGTVNRNTREEDTICPLFELTTEER